MNICVCCNFTAAVKNAYYFCCLKCYPNELDLLYRSLEQLDQVFLDTVKQKVTSCVEGANNQQMKEIRQGSVIIFHHIVRILPSFSQNITSYSQNITGTSYSQNITLYSQNITSYSQNVTSYSPNITSYSPNITSYSQNIIQYIILSKYYII